MSYPQHIASLISSATEMLYGIGAGDQVVAVSHECDYPAEVRDKPRATFSHIDSEATSQSIDHAVQQCLKSAKPLYEIDVALLEELKPDLIVTQAQCDVCAVKYDDVISAVQQMDSNPAVVALNPTSLSDVFEDIQRLAETCGRTLAANDFVDQLQNRIRNIRQAMDGLSNAERPRTALIEWIEPIMLSGNWMPEILELAGGSCPSTGGGHSQYFDWQQIVEWDPEVIIFCPCGFDLKRTVSEAALFGSRAGWSELTAVCQKRVYAADGNAYFNRSGPRLVDSAEILAHLIHPDRFDPPLDTEARAAAWCPLESL